MAESLELSRIYCTLNATGLEGGAVSAIDIVSLWLLLSSHF